MKDPSGCVLVGLLGALIVGVGCAPRERIIKQGDPLAPISVAGRGIEPVAFVGLHDLVPAGTMVGWHYDGWGQFKQFPYRAAPSPQREREERRLFSDELRRFGYTVVGSPSGLAAAEALADGARFLFEGFITLRAITTHAPLSGNKSIADVVITWQVYDQKRDVLILDVHIAASSELRGVEPSRVLQIAKLTAFRRLLSDPTLVSSLMSGQ